MEEGRKEREERGKEREKEGEGREGERREKKEGSYRTAGTKDNSEL